MTRTLVTTLLLALLAAPMALAQHGPPPGYTDPTVYAQDYAAEQAEQAQADPVGYAQGRDPAAEAEHAAWLACWTAYEVADHALDAACSQFFTAPVTVEPDVQGIEAEVTQVLNDTGVSALGSEVLDIVNDTVADPTSVLDQLQRAADAVIRFVQDLVDFVLDALGLGAMAIGAGLLGAGQGLLDLAAMPLDGLRLAAQGLADLGGAVVSLLGLAGSGIATASSTVGGALLGAASTLVGAVQDAASATGHGLADAASATVASIGDGAQAAVQGVADAAAAARDTVSDAVEKVSSLFDGKPKRSTTDRAGLPEAPKTGTDADGLIDRVLDAV
ncbi:MAG: hypothetical protein AABY18_03210 [Candidatus Thermoplasmatota archaeon]